MVVTQQLEGQLRLLGAAMTFVVIHINCNMSLLLSRQCVFVIHYFCQDGLKECMDEFQKFM